MFYVRIYSVVCTRNYENKAIMMFFANWAIRVAIPLLAIMQSYEIFKYEAFSRKSVSKTRRCIKKDAAKIALEVPHSLYIGNFKNNERKNQTTACY